MIHTGVAYGLCLAAAACTPAVPVPAALQPQDGSELVLVVHADGTQTYECRRHAGHDVDDYEWAFVGPDARLLDATGHVIGHHGAGPVWEANDGSRVVGTLVARTDSPHVNAIPWLLLSAASDGPPGMLSNVTSIQRVNTIGGAAPPIPCTRESLHRLMHMYYTADYRFFSKRRIL